MRMRVTTGSSGHSPSQSRGAGSPPDVGAGPCQRSRSTSRASAPPSHERRTRAALDRLRSALALAFVVAGTFPGAAPVAAQTINGTLLDLTTERPIDLGLVIMFTEEGDSVAMTVTDERGRFALNAPEPGSYLLLASALGYEETPAGVFELGEGGVMEVEYRIEPDALAIDELIVSVDRPVLEHKLVRNGFVRRLQRGLGAFVTPHDIEESPATATEDLLMHIPGVRIADIRVVRPAEDSLLSVYPRPDIGQTVQIRGPGGGWCTPTIYVDGVRSFYSPDPTTSQVGLTLSTIAPLATVEAIEVYRRPAEVPVEYNYAGSGGGATCGVLVVWTRSGPSFGQAVADASFDVPPADPLPGGTAPLPDVAEQGPPPTSGERIRMQLEPDVAQELGVTSPWEGTMLTVRSGELVGNDPRIGRVIAVPADGIEALHVRRPQSGIHALKRGALAGTAFGLGMWQFLRILCRSACDGGLGSAWLPASVTGTLVGALVAAQGPGTHWVRTPLPALPPGPGPRPGEHRR